MLNNYNNRVIRTAALIFGSIAGLTDISGILFIFYITKNNMSGTVVFIAFTCIIMAIYTISAFFCGKWIADKIFWYESMLDSLPFPISVTDTDMKWTFVNKPVEEMLKKERKDFIGKPCNKWGATICKTSNCGIECLRKNKNETFFSQFNHDFKVDIRYLHDRKGERSGHIEVVSDITDLLATQKQQSKLIEKIKDISNMFMSVSSEITNKTDIHSETVSEAANLVGTIKDNAETCSVQMEKMTGAMQEINEASSAIVTVTRAINDIARRTNILALNASVEAARVGEQGKSFAVVAEEIRNLAIQSTAQVADSKKLIQDSIVKSESGTNLVKETTVSLEKIMTEISERNEVISEITKISEMQRNLISRISGGIEDLSRMLNESQG